MNRFRLASLLLFTLFMVSLTVILPQSSPAQTFSVIHNFTGGLDGAAPSAGLVIDPAGNLYGTTTAGGSQNVGVVFKMTLRNSNWFLSPLYEFAGNHGDGAAPYDSVTRAANGILYGTTSAGGDTNYGTVFQLNPSAKPPTSANSSWMETRLYSFTGGHKGQRPIGNLIFDQYGNLYGTTNAGGIYNKGVVFRMMPSSGGWTQVVIYNFIGGDDGAYPFSGVIYDPLPALYGTTQDSGPFGYGTVYQLTPSEAGWSETTLHGFTGGPDGGNPTGGLIEDQAGNLYGATTDGGAGGGGTVFELTPSDGRWIFKILYSFTSPGGAAGPARSLVVDQAGSLYGTTVGWIDGNDPGTVFKLTPESGNWTYTLLHSFDITDGASPYSNLVFDATGNLYGTTYLGGTDGYGVVFQIAP